MAKINLNNIVSGFNLAKINDNFQKIATALNDNVLWRKNVPGEPNQMQNDLDMNGKRIYNLPAPVLAHEPARKGDLDSINSPDKLLRVTDVNIPAFPDAVNRRNKLVSFDNNGNPAVEFPSDDSATQLRIDIQTPTGVDPVGGFNSYTELRAYTGSATKVEILSKGLAGTFILNPSDTTTPDDGGTVIVDSLGRRWFRRFNGVIMAEWFGASADIADSTTGLQLWLNAIKAQKGYGIGPGEFKFSSKLTIPSISDFSLQGSGQSSTIFKYIGANTNTDLIEYGNGTSILVRPRIGGFAVQSDTTMTGGAAIHLRRVQSGSNINNIRIGYPGSSPKLWDGIWFDNVNVSYFDGFHIAVQNEGLIVNGSATTDEGSDLFLDHGFILGGTNPIHIGGGFGGFYAAQVLCYGGTGNSIVIDESRVSRGNREILLSDQCCLDGASSALLYINCPSPYLIVDCNAFLSGAGYFGATPGDNINVVSMPFGRLTIGSSHVKSAKRHGILIQDASAVVTISDKTLITDCEGWGLLSTVTTSNIKSNAVFKFNTTGDIHQNAQQYTIESVVVSSTAGTLGSATGTVAYTIEGGRLIGTVKLSVTDPGTASGALIFFAPKNIIQDFINSGANINTGKSVFARGDAVNNNAISVQNYDGSFPALAGSEIRVSLDYFFK